MNRDYPILIAEDQEDELLLLERALKRAGVTNPVRAVRDGQEALDYLCGAGKYADRTLYPFPGVLITDLKMPRRSGLDVLKWLQAHPECSVIPVIVLTSSQAGTRRQGGLPTGRQCLPGETG